VRTTPLAAQLPMGGTQLGAAALTGCDDARLKAISQTARGEADHTAEVARKLEGVFASMLVKEMRNASPGSFFGTDSAADVYGGWFDEHVGESIAKQGSLHIADFVQRLIQKNEGAQP
jgi:Rod binding domain-containing protein